MDTSQPLIVVADDDPRIGKHLQRILEREGFAVLLLDRSPAVLELGADRIPDLFLLDISMPELDGLEVCRRLRGHPRLSDVPVIFITGRDRTEDIVAGFEAGASDYITKPITPATLLARVRTHLRLHRSKQELERLRVLALDANPLTGLPGNNTIRETVARILREGAADSVLYCDLDHFKAFNDRHGFARGDEAILFTARIVSETARERGGAEAFVGHVGGDDFVVAVPSAVSRAVAEEIASRFDAGIGAFYDEEEREAGGIASRDRRGVEQFFPLMTISIGGVDLVPGRFTHLLEVVNASAEVKRYAKGMAGSSVHFDRRSAGPEDAVNPKRA